MGEEARRRVIMLDERQRTQWNRFREKMGVSAEKRAQCAKLSREH